MEVQQAKKMAKAKNEATGRQAEAAARKAERDARRAFESYDYYGIYQESDEDTDSEYDED